MKTFKLKSLIGVASLAIGLLVWSGHGYATEPGFSSFDEKYQKDNALIKEDIAAVHQHQAHVKELSDKLKRDKVAKLDQAVITDKRELCKAKADLKKSKAYLSADKTVLKGDYRLAIRNRQDQINKDQANLDKFKTKLNKDIANGTEESIAYDANKIAYYQNELRNDLALAKSEADHYESNFAFIDKQYKNTTNSNQASASVKTETAYARTNGKYYK